MPYTQTTQSDLITAISVAMEDPGNIYWKSDEIARAINEALLYWGALTSYWRERGTFSTTPATHYYDLAVQLPTLRQRTFTMNDIATEIQYALFERATGVSGTGLTAQFSAAQITDAIIRAADQFNLDIGIPEFTVINLTSPPPDGRVPLDDTFIALSRASFRSTISGVWTTLRREDEFSAQSFIPDWNLRPGQPQAYAMADAPPLTLQLIPAPLASGDISLLYQKALTLDAAASTLFDIPNEFMSAVKWYALYLLLNSYSECFDPYRAKYCLERYTQITAATESMRSVNRVQINGRLIPLDTIWNLDAGLPQWMNTTGTPQYSAAAWDVLALAPCASATTFSVTCDVVRSAPLPAAPGDFIQLGREELSYISDYVRHILSFKIGGTEFGATFPLHDNFLAGAKERNSSLTTRARYLTPLFTTAETNEDLLQTA